MTVVRRALAGVLAMVVLVAASGCSLFRQDGTTSVSVFDVAKGDCFTVPKDPEQITEEIATLPRVDCTEPHEQEAYARVVYTDPASGTTPDAFPGAAAVKAFADGTCAEEFADYVGVDYRDSQLFFTYLVPSARSWQQNEDRSALCFVTTTGEQLTRSVQGTKW